MTSSAFARADPSNDPRIDGKFLRVEGTRFLVKGVAYGTFAPNADGLQFPDSAQLVADFTGIAAAGFNTVRTYTVPSRGVLDAAARQGLRVMVGMPWPQHMAFLDDSGLVRKIRRDTIAAVRDLASHPAALMFAVGNEIPPGVVRWHGRARIERFLRSLYDDIKSASPDSLLTYVNFPPTEYLDLDCFDVCSFNVYLHREAELRAYLARLQHIAGAKPLLLAEAGGDSQREGQDGQARITAMHVRTAFAEGACGAVAFSWTDEWWRGGHTVDDWAFGLVDAQRRPKAALSMVSQVFAEAPFSTDEQTRWPAVTVVVCAYDAADTIDDCLTSLATLTYPKVEIIVVNDGSSDATGSIARRHDGVRVIDVPNGGLSAARNVGLAAASGDIVAYTDADARVDPDWLSYLVQPLLEQALAGVGGPNVVPHDDSWMAQCIARAPGGPTHVLVDDRIAEHVPGCNMAFWRETLLSIGGFNPVFLRAGDDVDICWRLQAKGLRIGFAPAALVWHHHRTTTEAFWRQQVGYGEAEAWLNVHHPEKFSGGRMLWRGRIYSPLPFARDLRQPHVNTGVWGTAAFPSVYFAESQLWRFLPHSAAWMTLSSALIVLGALGLPDPSDGAAWLSLAGAGGWLTTIARCLVLAQRSDLRGLPKVGRLSPALSRLVYRGSLGWLHLLQPLARIRGRLRGMWSLPKVAPTERGTREPWQLSLPSFSDARRSGRLLAGLGNEQTFWSESWLAHTTVLSELADVLRALQPAHVVELDDGWRPERDLSLAIGRWGWLDVRVLVEEHAEGRCLTRVGTRLRVSSAGLVQGLALAALVAAGVAAARFGWPTLAGFVTAMAVAATARGAWRTSRAMAVVRRALARVSDAANLIPLPVASSSRARGARGWRVVTPVRALQAALLIIVIALAGIGRRSGADTSAEDASANSGLERIAAEGGLAVGIAGDIFVADPQQRVIRRLRPRPPAGASLRANDIAADGNPILGTAIPFEAAADIAIATNGDLFIADARHNHIRRVVPSTGESAVIAGSGFGGFSGDGRAAQDAALHGPSALALAHNGDLYFADALNNRVRVIVRATGLIRTVAGDGREGSGEDIGDGGPATSARLNRPDGLAVAHNGDLYIADTGHHRVRKISASTGLISTVAGDGVSGGGDDGGPAARVHLATPTGLALAPSERGVFVYVADSGNNRVRVIDPDGSIATLKGSVVAPTRIAYHPAGWLYVKDSSPDGVTALATSVPSAAAPHVAKPSLGGD